MPSKRAKLKLQQKVSKVVKVTKSFQIVLDKKALLEILKSVGYTIPENADITVPVPGGGDWSNMILDIGTDSNIVIDWTETSTKEEEA